MTDEHKYLSENHIILSYRGFRRLQRFYGIPASDMAVGRYNGRIIGDKINGNSCFFHQI